MASIHPIPFVSFVFFCKKDPLGLYALCSAVLLLPFPSVFIRAIRGRRFCFSIRSLRIRGRRSVVSIASSRINGPDR